MTLIIKPERETQNRLITVFRNELKYSYLGDWRDRPNNSNIEEETLNSYLKSRGYSAEQINRAIYRLRTEATNPNRSLYDNNEAVYSLLRYGVPVKVEAGKATSSTGSNPTKTTSRSPRKSRCAALSNGAPISSSISTASPSA